MEVRNIQPEDTYALRQSVLAPSGNKDYFHFENDHDDKTFHLGCFIEKQLVSVASFYFEKNPLIPDLYQYRVRGMATLAEYRGQGLGSALLQTAFPHIMQNQGTVLWCYSREATISFYIKNAFQALGEKFDRPLTGPHQLMFKKLV